MNRKNTEQILVGGVPVGGGAQITVQSMTTTNTADADATISQIHKLQDTGCDIIRVAVPDKEAAKAISTIKAQIAIPIVADIHFDYRLALRSIEAGVDKIRLNPGNIGSVDRVRSVVSACKERKIPIRIGVNSGSVSREMLAKYGGPTAEALVESALEHIRILEDLAFGDICVSIKASNVPVTIESYRLMSELRSYPLHLGVTETGTAYVGTIKSSIGIGTLLSEGIGDTIRVSLTADPVEEIKAGLAILSALRIRNSGVEIVSCPTCGRCGIDLIGLAEQVENATKHIKKDIKIAVMGCAVNGPGEAREADYGVAGGQGAGLIFKKGEIVGKVPYDDLLTSLLKMIESEENLQ